MMEDWRNWVLMAVVAAVVMKRLMHWLSRNEGGQAALLAPWTSWSRLVTHSGEVFPSLR